MRDSHTDFSATLQCFQIDTHFCPPSTGVVETKGNEKSFDSTYAHLFVSSGLLQKL